ncbi:MAG: glutathione S-transferase N-terminal domain-containing protein [Xanthobacteraceae bacterium]|jgi:glutathione S-transferase
MKLHWSPRSPFVRKVMVVAHECGVVDRLTCVRTVVETAVPHAELMRENPLSKIPTLVLDDGNVLYDSPVICEYLDALDGAPKLFPRQPKARIVALCRQALGDGFLDLLVLNRNERARPQPSDVHLASAAARKVAVLEHLEREAEALTITPFGIGHIAIGCALSYLDFRYADENWRKNHLHLANWHAGFAARPSVRATEPVDDS